MLEVFSLFFSFDNVHVKNELTFEIDSYNRKLRILFNLRASLIERLTIHRHFSHFLTKKKSFLFVRSYGIQAICQFYICLSPGENANQPVDQAAFRICYDNLARSQKCWDLSEIIRRRILFQGPLINFTLVIHSAELCLSSWMTWPKISPKHLLIISCGTQNGCPKVKTS